MIKMNKETQSPDQFVKLDVSEIEATYTDPVGKLLLQYNDVINNVNAYLTL